MRNLALALAILGLGFMNPARGDSLTPGVYTMQWVIPKSRPDWGVGGPYGDEVRLAPISGTGKARPGGLASIKAMWGHSDWWTAILDESKGTGTGYDTLYVVLEVTTPDKINLARAARVSVKDNGYTWRSDVTSGTPITLHIGSEASATEKPVEVDAVVWPFNYYPIVKPERHWNSKFVNLQVRGGWLGLVMAESGPVNVRIYDMDHNGVFNDKASAKGMGDYINLQRGELGTRSDTFVAAATPGVPFACWGALYVATSTTLGDSIAISKFQGPTGTVRVVVSDGRKRQSPAYYSVSSKQLGWFGSSGGKEITVPAGRYEKLSASLRSLYNNNHNVSTEVSFTGTRPITVKAGETTTVDVGGKLGGRIGNGAGPVTIKADGDRRIPLVLTAGEYRLGILYPPQPKMRLRDSRGRTVWTGEPEYEKGKWTVLFPWDIRPGVYKLSVTYTCRPYPGTGSAEKVVKVLAAR